MENDTPQALRVVVADDEPVMQMYLEETVSLLGHEVVAVAKDGPELVALCLKMQPNLIVTDIRMPVFDGYEAVRRICHDAALPVVFVSGFNEAARAETVEGCCIANYLTKPIDELELSRGISMVLARFDRYLLLKRECGDAQDVLPRFRLVQRALERISRHEGIKEAEAFERLQELAKAQGWPLAETAERLLSGDEFN